MVKYFARFVLVSIILAFLGSEEIKADTGSSGYIGPTSTDSSQNVSSTSSTSSGVTKPTAPDPSQIVTPAPSSYLNKTDGISGPIVNLSNLPTQAPTFNVNYNFDDLTQSFGVGRLGSVSYDTGTAGFVYDQLGREITCNETIGGVNYNVA